MDTERLKQKILTLAIQGKLVPQDPNDDPASELFKKIKKEKEKLIKEGKIKKEKELAEISENEKPFEIPESWEWVRLGDLCKLITKGSSPKWQGVNYINHDDGVFFITSENVGKYNLILNNKKYLEWKFNEIEPKSILEKGDILMNIVGASIGRTAMFDLDAISNINQAVCLIRVVESYVYRPYLLYFFNSLTCLNYMLDKQVDNARANLSMGNIGNFLIPLPSLNEQKNIVIKLIKLFSIIDEMDKEQLTLSETIKNIKEKTLSLAIKGKLVPQDENDESASELLKQINKEKDKLIKEGKIKKEKTIPIISEEDKPFEIPNNWGWCRLGQLGQILGGGTPKTELKENWEDGTIPWMTPADMKNIKGKYVSRGDRLITEKGLKNSSTRLLPKDSLLYSSRAPIGYIAIAENDICTNQGFKSLVPIKKDIVNYLYYYLIAQTKEIIDRASGTTFKEISGQEFSLTVISLPPLEEQQRIVRKIEEIMNYCNNIEELLN